MALVIEREEFVALVIADLCCGTGDEDEYCALWSFIVEPVMKMCIVHNGAVLWHW